MSAIATDAHVRAQTVAGRTVYSTEAEAFAALPGGDEAGRHGIMPGMTGGWIIVSKRELRSSARKYA